MRAISVSEAYLAWRHRLARSRRPPSERGRSEAQGTYRSREDDGQVPPQKRRGARVGPDFFESLDGIGEGHCVRKTVEPAGHALPRDKEPAHKDLGEHHGWHELDSLELALGKGAEEQPERHAEDGKGKRPSMIRPMWSKTPDWFWKR